MRREQANGRRKRNRWILAGFVVVLIIVISVSVSVTQKNKKAADAFKTAERSQLREMIDTALNKEGITTVPLDSIESYQYRALDWLSKNKELPNYDRSTVLQRYALACFYFATNGAKTLYTPTPSPWKSSERWLSDMHECQWEGIECNTRNKVAGINLSEHNLSGALPQELVFLKDHLEVLDLTTNHLFIDGAQFDVFGRLSNLQIILMDDNYLSSSDGLPAAFGQCSNLVKLRLSYNLIGGQLNGKLLESFQKLTHLELESNFITGGIPNSVGHMHNLVYFYMRRNSLKFNLDFLKPGKMKSLCK